MPTGVVLGPGPNAANHVDEAIDQARRAHGAGVQHVWLAQQFDHDAIALAGLIGAAVPGLGVGTSAVPINPRHPLLVASAGQTAQAAAHGNFSLGLALGGHELERLAFGTDWTDPVGRLREHLTVLRSVLDTGAVDFHGTHLSAANPEWPVEVSGGSPLPVYVAAMGPKALRVTGELADGTLPYLAGPRTLADFIVPTITEAAAAAGQPAPKIIAAVPVLVCEDSEDEAIARKVAAQKLAFYETIPSYQKIIAREGVAEVVELAAVGSPAQVLDRLQAYRNAGATDLILSPLRTEPDDLHALWQVAAAVMN